MKSVFKIVYKNGIVRGNMNRVNKLIIKFKASGIDVKPWINEAISDLKKHNNPHLLRNL